jgi:hypothetical protein
MQRLEVTAHIDFNPDFSIGCRSLAKRVARQIGHCCVTDSPSIGDAAVAARHGAGTTYRRVDSLGSRLLCAIKASALPSFFRIFSKT